MKRFKNFKDDDEWGNPNEDRIREKKKVQKIKHKRKRKEEDKFSAFE